VSLSFAGSVDYGRFVLDAAFECEPGQTTALVGPNGSGKSTILNVMAGLQRLSTGTVSLDDEVIDGNGSFVPPDRRDLGVVFQDLLLFPHLSTLDNVAYGLRRSGWRRREARQAALQRLTRLDVGHLASAPPRSLSGGQAQRVALARAMACQPHVLLLDEPLSALDTETRLAVRCELHNHLLASQGYALLVAHDVVDVVVLADRVVVLEAGRVAQVGSPAEIEHRPRTPFAAALFGTNLLRGHRRDGCVELGPNVLVPVPAGPVGPVDVVVAPRHVRVSPVCGDRRNGDWVGTVVGVEPAGDDVHVRVGGPVPLAARAGFDTLRDLELHPGADLVVHIDPAGVAVIDDPSPFLDQTPTSEPT
jgi:molybdate transport system ATP-binding protein